MIDLYPRLTAQTRLRPGSLLPVAVLMLAACFSYADADSCATPDYSRHSYRELIADSNRTATLTSYNGKRIAKIEFLALDVFDTDLDAENVALYRLINKLHIVTRDPVLEAQLLVHEGDSFNAKKLEESERILRSRVYLSYAFIMPTRICEDSVDLLVVTQDAWTLEPEITLSRSGGDTKSGFGLSETNLLGTGNTLNIGYLKDENRERVYYNFGNRYFLNREIDFALGYADTTDGEDTLLRIAHPFYSLHTPWALGMTSSTVNLNEKIQQGDLLLQEYRHESLNGEVYFGVASSVSDSATIRFYTGLTEEKSTYQTTGDSTGPAPVSEDYIYSWVGYEFIENEYAVYRNINQIQRNEDVAMGLNLNLRVGYGKEDLSGLDALAYRASFYDVLGVGKNHLLSFSALFDGRDYQAERDRSRYRLDTSVDYNAFINNNNRWYTRLGYRLGHNLLPHEEVTAGGDDWLRGYPTAYLRGDQLLQFTVERRFFSDIHLFNLVRMGYLVFFDAGHMQGGNNRWYQPPGAEEAFPTPGSKTLYDLGIGIRLTSSKTHVGSIIHVDVAMPLVDREFVSDVQIRMKAQQAF